ncbi:hypothetical protein ACSS6W_005692 [Trichoderma asperelloides]
MSSKPGSQTVTSTDDNADDETKRSVEAAEPSDQPSLSPTAVAFILLGLSLPVFLIALDTSIVATWTFLSFFAVFELGSLLCATAVSSNMFIGGRAVAGAGGAGIVSGAFSIVAFIAPLQKRPQTEPIARRIRALDLIGASLFIPAILMALLALQWGGSTYAWKSATIIGLFLGFGGLCVVFVLWQIYKGEEAMLPMTILLNRTVAFSSLTLAFAYGAIFSVVYYLPEWFQVVKGAGPIRSGVMNLPTFIPQIAAALVSGALAPKLGPLNPWVYIGCALMAIGIGLYGTFDLSTPSSHWIGYQILPGIGFGLMAQMPVVAVQASLPTSQSPLGVSTATFSQFFGSAIFLAISQAVFSNIFINKLTVDIPGVDLQSLIASGSGAIRKLVPPDDLPVVLGAFNQALVGTFYLSAAASAAAVLISFGIPWINIKGKNLVIEPGA